MRVRLTKEAFADLDEAVSYYHSIDPQLERDFSRRVVRGLKKIRDRPENFAIYEGARLRHEYRRVMLNRFPYVIIYRIDSEEVVVVAISRGSRKPGYWER